MANISQLKTGISLLRWQGGKFLPKGKINPKTLGYVCPNGTINFQTAESAQTYAKNRVMSALHAPKPFERAVFVEDSRIIGDIDGTVHKVHFDHKIIEGHKDVSLVHGHPTSTPLSDVDYSCLVANNELKSIIAYNKRGEYSKMTKEKKHWLFKLLPDKYYQILKIGRMDVAKKRFKEYAKTDFKELATKIIDIQKAHKGKTKEEIIATEEGQKLKEFARKALTAWNNIWAKNEKMFGIKYETDYSKLL